ncbi:hypothetical protein BOX15_Mlig033435g1 [Macrostomum lignano]|uniref:Uncharacterized protein n=1 Tax=Macrostomum lignano TaxID=282301 RepID=A0A267FEG1_9PLAT|nr:hypothetical protein BOX15_Mlig033435g1 [Macrostomum lignano]
MQSANAIQQIESMRQEYIRDTLQLVPRQQDSVLQDCQLLLARYYEAADKEERRQSRLPDSDGWVTVSYKKSGSTAKPDAAEAQAEGTKAKPEDTPAAETEDAARALVFGRGQSRARRQLERQRRREKLAAAELQLALGGAKAPKATRAEEQRNRLGALRASFAEKLRAIAEQRKFRPEG